MVFASCNQVVELLEMVSSSKWMDIFPGQTAIISGQRVVERMHGRMVEGGLSIARSWSKFL